MRSTRAIGCTTEIKSPSGRESWLNGITWPETVHGCAALVERVVLPPDVEAQLPDEPARAASYAAEHPDRQEVRIVAAATRAGAS